MKFHGVRLFFLFFLISAFPLWSQLAAIDLGQICDSQNQCRSRPWWIIDSQNDKYFQLKSDQLGDWQKINTFPIWTNQHFPPSGSLTHYTFLTYVQLQPQDLAFSDIPGISMAEIGEVFSIYINGHLIHSDGKYNQTEVTYHRTVRGQVYQIPRNVLKIGNNQILIRISGNPKYDHTGFYLSQGYHLGNYDELKYENREYISYMLIAIYLAVGFYHFFLYLKRRSELYNLHFTFFSAGLGIYLITRSNLVFQFAIDSYTIQRIELAILYSFFCMTYVFPQHLFNHRHSKYTRYYSYFNYTLSLVTLFLPLYICEMVLRIWQISVLFFGLPLIFIIYYQALRKKITNARHLFIGMLFTLVAAIFDILDSAIFNTGISLSKYTFFLYTMSIATLLANRFIELHNQLAEWSDTLEQKVKDRTREVTDKMEQIAALNEKQNGDYFLTSLIEKPLTTNYNKSKIIKTEFYLEQKKKFTFRRRSSELGGDICISGNLRFYQKDSRYVFFFNGDAMGKSMQGAGGAIVAGTVVNNILGRSARDDRVLDMEPETWLEEVYQELDSVFSTFDGSMLMSAVVGIINESDGEMWYFNAEHPYIVLYRDAIPSFLGEDAKYLPKLGSQLDFGTLQIEKYQLLPGDILFCGSDGRDDIEFPSENNIRNINDDEKLFLQIVKDGQGKLAEMVKIIKQAGTITDDLSFIKLTYMTKQDRPL